MKKTRYYLKLSPKTKMGRPSPSLKEWVRQSAYQFRYANNVIGKMKDVEEFRYYYDKKTKELYSYQRPVLMFADEWETRGLDAPDVLIDKIVEVDLEKEREKTLEQKIKELKAFQKKRRAAINNRTIIIKKDIKNNNEIIKK